MVNQQPLEQRLKELLKTIFEVKENNQDAGEQIRTHTLDWMTNPTQENTEWHISELRKFIKQPKSNTTSLPISTDSHFLV